MRSPRRAATRAFAVAGAGLLAAAAVAVIPGRAGADDFVNGSGNASAQVLRVGPAAGHLALAPQFGLSLADFLDTLGRGESRIFEWGALEGSVPQQARDNTPNVGANSESAPSADGAFPPAPPTAPIGVGAMKQHADATKAPLGHSTFTLGDFEIPGVVKFAGASSESSAGLVGDGLRQAKGVVDVASVSLGAGQVTLSGLHWEAVQTTDASNTAKVTGGFSVKGATINGQAVAVPADPAQAKAVFDQMNAALAPSGLVLDVPVLHGDSNVATITPLAIRIINSPIGQQAVAPVIGAAQPVRQPITDGLIQNCSDCSGAVLVADVTSGVISGGGRFDLEIGGASAYTEGTKYDTISFDFSSGGLGGFGASSDFSSASGDSNLSSSPSSLGSSSLSSSPSVSTTGASLGAATAKPSTAASTKPAARPGGTQNAALAGATRPASPKGDAALAIGLVGLLGAVALGAADFRTIRAARRTIPT
ncbi:MAG TPA: choice-of-anchor P family protein [Acidimicrobiales bacterium]|nr:choice-of-anchor P family protein [Acidimicrobiales bacterium]